MTQTVEQIAKALREWGCGNYAPDVPTHMRHCREAADLLEASLTKQADRDAVERVFDGSRPLPWDREQLGRFVREAWVRWAETQPNPKPSWLVPYDELSEPDKEADRQIGEAVARWTLIGDAAALSASRPESVDETGWLIEHGGHSIPTYWTGESWGRWSSDHKRACRFARREDAFKVSLALGDTPHDPPHKIIEHMWMKP